MKKPPTFAEECKQQQLQLNCSIGFGIWCAIALDSILMAVFTVVSSITLLAIFSYYRPKFEMHPPFKKIQKSINLLVLTSFIVLTSLVTKPALAPIYNEAIGNFLFEKDFRL